MKSKTIKSIILMVAMLCLLCFPVQVMAETQQGTNGDELQLMEAEKLEIQLGTDWAGVEFQLKTDAGLYPGTVVVGQDGVLRMEIGGSKSYILTCMNSAITVPEPTQAPATTETDPEETNHGTETAEEGSTTVAGIPVLHIVLFAGGMVVAVGVLIAMTSNRRPIKLYILLRSIRGAVCINAIAIWLITVLLVFLISQKTRAELFIQ